MPSVTSQKHNIVLFELSYEVVHKVGGIHTVIRTKASQHQEQFGDNFYMLGPYLPGIDSRYHNEFEEMEVPSHLKVLFDQYQTVYGSRPHFGRWLIHSTPQVILFDPLYPSQLSGVVDEARNRLRQRFGIDVALPGDVREPFKWNAAVFGVMAWLFLKMAMGTVYAREDTNCIMQSHEWQGAFCQLLFDTDPDGKPANLSSIFITHATTLGRHLSAAGVDLCRLDYDRDWDAEAAKRQVLVEHLTEKQAACHATVFGCVSEVTGQEAKHFFGRDADVFVYNGLNVSKTRGDDRHRLQTKHLGFRNKLLTFARAHFYGQPLHEDHTIFMFSAGRLEYTNKGFDLYLSALASLNQKMKAAKSKKTVVALLIAPTQISQPHVETLKGITMMRELQEDVTKMSQRISKKIFDHVSLGMEVDSDTLLDADDRMLLKRYRATLRRSEGFPPIVTHSMKSPAQEHSEPILKKARELGLINHPDDPVKFVWSPCFVNKMGLFGLDYMELVRGCHLGCFPSNFEPFGLTPAESSTVGTPSITTNRAGFGVFVETLRSATPMRGMHSTSALLRRVASNLDLDKQGKVNQWNKSEDGIMVLDRIMIGPEETLERLAVSLYEFTLLSRMERIALRSRTERRSALFDWKLLISKYVEAQDLSLARISPERFSQVIGSPSVPSTPMSPSMIW